MNFTSRYMNFTSRYMNFAPRYMNFTSRYSLRIIIVVTCLKHNPEPQRQSYGLERTTVCTAFVQLYTSTTVTWDEGARRGGGGGAWVGGMRKGDERYVTHKFILGDYSP